MHSKATDFWKHALESPYLHSMARYKELYSYADSGVTVVLLGRSGDKIAACVCPIRSRER